VFISVLALHLTNLLYRKITLANLSVSKEECIELLEDIKEIHLNYGDDEPSEVILTQMSAIQRKLCNVLDLKQFKEK